jgi:hypothetical protein
MPVSSRCSPALSAASSAALAIELGFFGVGLGMHRDVFAGGHRHRAGHQAGHAGDQHRLAAAVGRGHPEHQAGGGHDAVVGAEHGGAQPADSTGAV